MKAKECNFKVVEIRDRNHTYTVFSGTISQCVNERERILKAQEDELLYKPYYSREYRDKNDTPFRYEITL